MMGLIAKKRVPREEYSIVRGDLSSPLARVGEYFVFVEMDRRSTFVESVRCIPLRIIPLRKCSKGSTKILDLLDIHCNSSNLWVFLPSFSVVDCHFLALSWHFSLVSSLFHRRFYLDNKKVISPQFSSLRYCILYQGFWRSSRLDNSS